MYLRPAISKGIAVEGDEECPSSRFSSPNMVKWVNASVKEPDFNKGSIVMGDHDPDLSRSSVGVRPFPSTHWSMLLAAGDVSSGANAALEEVCRKYWRPLYAYVRRRGYGAEDAEDLTQEFLAHFIEKRYLGLADPQRGRFRSFLLDSAATFLVRRMGSSACGQARRRTQDLLSGCRASGPVGRTRRRSHAGESLRAMLGRGAAWQRCSTA